MSAITQTEVTMENVFGEDKKQNLIKLRELVKENSELSAFQMNDEYLLQFLCWTSFDVSVAIEKMKGFQKILMKYSGWFATKPPLEMKTMLEKNLVCLLDARDKEGRAIFIVSVANLDLNYSIEENAIVIELHIDYGHMQAKTRENGICFILDMENLPWKILTWATPKNIKIMVHIINGYPCKDIKMHVVKTSFILDAIIKMVWPLLPANIKEMMKFHFNNWSSLHEYINQEDLPSEYGGTGPDINFDYYQQKIFDKNDEIKERLQFRKAIIKD